jgi:hypothetical protein
MYSFMSKVNSCKSHFNAPDTVMSTRAVCKFTQQTKALTMVHPVDEPVDAAAAAAAVPPEEAVSEEENYLLYLTKDEENGDKGDVKEKGSETVVVRSVLSPRQQQVLRDW